jgi:hypothetical protein
VVRQAIFLALAVPLLAAPAAASSAPPLQVTIRPFGPSEAQVQGVEARLLRLPALQEKGASGDVRVLAFRFLDEPDGPGGAARPPRRYVATLFDYSHNRGFEAEGEFASPGVQLRQLSQQPLPSPEEFRRAVEILKTDSTIGAALSKKSLHASPPMPPLASWELPGANRTVTVGLIPIPGSGESAEIVGVDMIRKTVVRFPNGAPPTATATVSTCGFPDAGQTTTGQGTLGQYQVTISSGATTVWSFLAIRPSISSGLRGSGIEVRNVDYLGKRVLGRGHLPILNILYTDGACGPYRDWQYQESEIQATGTDVAQGFRLCTTLPETILESHADQGNFLGVGVYATANEVFLVSEMEAGWYRYISRWQFDKDGTIHPRWGFSAVANSCVCHPHVHHAYFRFDFDVVSSDHNSIIEEGPTGSQPRTVEAKVYRHGQQMDPLRQTTWLVQNTQSGEGYRLRPGGPDGDADSFGQGDLWFLHYSATELDDGINCTTCTQAYAHLDNFVNGESVADTNVVVWYGIHFDHNFTHPPHDFYFGPDLVPVSW